MARVLVFDSSAVSRLQILASLEVHEATAVEAGADPLKALRRLRPEVFLVSLAEAEALPLLHRVRTDGGVLPLLGTYEAGAHRLGPDVAVRRAGADGWLGDTAAVSAFVDSLLLGPLPVQTGTFRPSLLARLARRLRGLGV